MKDFCDLNEDEMLQIEGGSAVIPIIGPMIGVKVALLIVKALLK